jgi:hypothetical protein
MFSASTRPEAAFKGIVSASKVVNLSIIFFFASSTLNKDDNVTS